MHRPFESGRGGRAGNGASGSVGSETVRRWPPPAFTSAVAMDDIYPGSAGSVPGAPHRVRRSGLRRRGLGGARFTGPGRAFWRLLLASPGAVAPVWGFGNGARGFVRAGGGRGRADGARWLFAWDGFRLFLRRPFPVAGWGRGGGWDYERASRGCLSCCVGVLGATG